MTAEDRTLIREALSRCSGVKEVHISEAIHVVTDMENAMVRGNRNKRNKIYDVEKQLIKLLPHLHFDFTLRDMGSDDNDTTGDTDEQ